MIQQQVVERQNRIMRMTENIVRKKLPNIVYYNDDHSKSPTCTHELSMALGATYSLPSTWSELTKEIENGEDKITFHIDMISKSSTRVKDFVDSIKTIIKFMPNHKPLRILVLIKPETTQYMVQQLKDAGVFGIGFDINYYSIAEVIESVKHQINGEPYWPEHIINKLPGEKKKPINVFFRKDCEKYFHKIGGPEAVNKLSNNAPWQVLMCSSWDDLGKAMDQEPHQICFHVDMVTQHSATMSECVSMIDTLARISNLQKIPIGIGIDRNTPMSLIKEAQKCDILGIVPAALDFGIEEAYKGIEALFNRIPYWPKHILQQLPGAKKTVTQNTIRLTSRQAQIVNLISERGLTNKKIAQALNITESTVKIHVSAILKAYGVRTRTQLALAAIK